MQQKAGAQIGKKAFIQSLVILLALMMLAGALTLVIPSGRYTRTIVEGREVIDPASFQFVERPAYAICRWFTAPVEVLGGSDGLTVVSYAKWLKWTLKLWLWVLLITIAFLGLAVAIDFGPF